MKITVTEYMFTQAFKDAGRADSFSYEAQKALFNFYDELDDDCGNETELDVVAICGDWDEYPDQDTALVLLDFPDWDTLQDSHYIIEFDGGFLISTQ